ncbi:hypothetical protein N9H63_00145 [bacterium]|nr:hypothetical protein [bacterium]
MYKFDHIEKVGIDEMVSKGTKTIYNIDNGVTASEWVRKEVKGKKSDRDLPKLSSALEVKQKGYSKLCEGAFGYFFNAGNNCYYNGTNIALFSSAFSNKSGLSVIPENLHKVVAMFSARKLITTTWLNQKDEYSAPNENHIEYQQFIYDSFVYSLFNSSSQQSSLRQVEYKDKMWDIKNEFFWMSKDRMKELADENGYDNLYNDARTSSDRHVYNLLFGEERIYDKLSDDAKAVLDKATELVEQSMTLRQVMADDYNHLDSWDAGYAQLKLVWKEYFEEDFKEFRQLYKTLEDRMRPLVYELGFLMK